MTNPRLIFNKYFNGEYPFAKTFWLGLLSVYLPSYFGLPFALLATGNSSTPGIKLITGAIFVLFAYSYYPLAIIFPFAVYRASKKYTGWKIWKYAAILFSSSLAFSAAYVFIFVECLGGDWPNRPTSVFIRETLFR